MPTDDIESIKRRNEEMQRRLQEELSKLKPTEIPPPPSAFANAIDAALSSTPLDELTPDFGVPITPEAAPPPVVEPTAEAPAAPPEFSFESIEETVEVNPPIPEEFGIPKTPFFAEDAAPPPQPAAAAPTAPTAEEEDFFADLPSSWSAPTPAAEPAPAVAEAKPEEAAPVAEEAAPPAEEEPVPAPISEAQPEPEFGWQPPFAEAPPAAEFEVPVEEFAIPEPATEPEPQPEFVPPITEPAPMAEEAPVVEEPIAEPAPIAEEALVEEFAIPEPVPVAKEELPRVIVALEGERLRWGRVGIESEEEAIELLERAIAVYRTKHPKP